MRRGKADGSNGDEGSGEKTGKGRLRGRKIEREKKSTGGKNEEG